MLIFISSFLIFTLMGMGVGGGGLFVIFLTLCLNYPQLLAQGTNLLLFIVAGISSLLFHIAKRRISLSLVLSMILFGSLGSVVFSRLAHTVSPEYAKIALGALLIVSGFLTLYNTFIKNLLKKFKKTLYK
ncbi:MAG: sulfite exporter TauE/SafE family protein [Clostridia bacterium]|nr:sulfite exporter TauE/SafE family protein [Clostridia bacterium]